MGVMSDPYRCPRCLRMISWDAICLCRSPEKTHRKATSGATRDTSTGKPAYDKVLHPLVVKRYAEYMHGHCTMKDGSSRAGDNWWKGFPREWLMESMFRHFVDVWFHTKGMPGEAVEHDSQTALCALLFNVQAMLLEELLGRDVQEEETDVPANNLE